MQSSEEGSDADSTSTLILYSASASGSESEDESESPPPAHILATSIGTPLLRAAINGLPTSRAHQNTTIDGDGGGAEDYGDIFGDLDFGDDDFSPVRVPRTVERIGPYTTLGIFDSLHDAEIARQKLCEFVYTYDTRYTSKYVSATIYSCRSHKNCPHKVKISTRSGGASAPSRYELLQQGHHRGARVAKKKRGISPVLKPEIDALLLLGTGAGRVRNMLLFKYRNDNAVLELVPKTKQLENRKMYLKALRLKNDGGWEIDNFNVLRNWASAKMCSTREDFESVDAGDSSAMKELIVLDTFEHTSTVSGSPVQSIGLILTSRTVFRGVAQAAAGQPGSLVMATDGAYRIHFGGWTLIDCGGISVQRSRASYVQRFQPWLYMFVRAECEFAYAQMFRTLVRCAQEFFEITVQITSCSIDHSDPIASALESVWPEVEVVTCWEHLLRSAKKTKQVQRLTDKSYLDTIVMHLKWLHLARSLKQFRALSKRVILAWRTAGEESYADWFQETYLSPRWERWFVNGSSIPGFLPTQQPIEAHHRVIKVIVTDFKKAPTETVLKCVLPRVLLYDADNNTHTTYCHYCEGHLPTESVVKATAYLIQAPNHQTIFSRRDRSIPEKILFNSTKAMIRPKSLCGSSVSTERSQRLVASMVGRLGSRSPITTAQFNYLSLQHVQLNRSNAADLPTFNMVPTWQLANVAAIRNAMRCTCKRYMHSGWVCAHIIAALHLLQKLDLSTALQHIPMRGPPGRPRQLEGPLMLEDPSAMDFFSVNKLTNLFTQQPGRPLRWPYVEEFDVNDGDSRFREHRVGQVAGCRLSEEDGVFEWSVSYLHGDVLYYQVEELVQGIIQAKNIGAL